MGRTLIALGAILILAGILITYGEHWFGLWSRMPGNFVFRRGNFTFYFPLGASILLSIALSLLLWFFGRVR